jgi:hypothetical protein
MEKSMKTNQPSMLLKKLRPLAAILIFTACSQAATLSTNLSAPTYYTELINGSNFITAGFQTGDSAYILSSVTALMQQDAPGTLNLSLYSSAPQPAANDLGVQPGTLLGTLTFSGSYSSALSQVTFGGNNLQLSPDTTYWLVMSSTTGTYEWAYAADNSGSGAGFYPSWGTSTDSGASWYTNDLQPMQMSVTADPAVSSVPEPGVTSLSLMGLALCGVKGLKFLRR